MTADERAQVRRLVSIVETTIVLEESATEEQRYVMRFCGKKTECNRDS
jgi:hypothetical protein